MTGTEALPKVRHRAARQESDVIDVWACDSEHPGANGEAAELMVRFTIPARDDIESAVVVGDFNDWSESSTPMTARDGGFTATVRLRAGRRYRFKYLLNGARWENDWSADDYVTNRSGGDDSVLDLRFPSDRPAGSDLADRLTWQADRHWRQATDRTQNGFERDGRALAEFLRVRRDQGVRACGRETAPSA